jgi:hypothetical protein
MHYASGPMGEARARSRNIARPAWSETSRAAQQPFMWSPPVSSGYAAALSSAENGASSEASIRRLGFDRRIEPLPHAPPKGH